MKTETKAILGILLLAAILAPASAFGVSSQYWAGNDLQLLPGESKIIYFELQNMIGDEDMVANVEIQKGGEILTFVEPGKAYSVPAKTQGVYVPIRVSIPSETKTGTVYPVSLLFKVGKPTPTGGMVGISTGIYQDFSVFVGEEEKIAPSPVQESKPVPFSAIGLAVLFAIGMIAIVYTFLRKKRK